MKGDGRIERETSSHSHPKKASGTGKKVGSDLNKELKYKRGNIHLAVLILSLDRMACSLTISEFGIFAKKPLLWSLVTHYITIAPLDQSVPDVLVPGNKEWNMDLDIRKSLRGNL